MRIFGKKTHSVLEKLLLVLKMDMSNNYKDNAQDDFSKLEEAFAEMLSSGKLSKRHAEYYAEQIVSSGHLGLCSVECKEDVIPRRQEIIDFCRTIF